MNPVVVFLHTIRGIISLMWNRLLWACRTPSLAYHPEMALGKPSFNGFIAYLDARPPTLTFSAFDPYEDAYAEYCQSLRTQSPYSLRGIAAQLDVPIEVISKVITARNYGEAADRAKNYRAEMAQ
jgi:hypothetical protein